MKSQNRNPGSLVVDSASCLMLLLLLLIGLTLGGCEPRSQIAGDKLLPPQTVDEIRAADQEEVRAILDRDPEVQSRIWAGDFVVTSAHGQVLRKDEIMRALQAGPAPYQAFERETEEVRIHGDVAVSMGLESVVPAGPELGDAVTRRFTHVWVKRDGAWRLAVRHASVLPEDRRGI